MDCCGNPMAMARLVCPKPRRVVSLPSNLKISAPPMGFHTRNVAFDSKRGAESLDLILRKVGLDAEQCANVSSPPFFDGSPPRRVPNPMVKDAHFMVASPPFFDGSPPLRVPNPMVEDALFRVEKLTTFPSFSDSDSLPTAQLSPEQNSRTNSSCKSGRF